MTRRFVTIAPDQIGKPFFKAFDRLWLASSFIGRVMPGDVGKRVYLAGDAASGQYLQVENDAQRAQRTGKDPLA